MKKIFYTINFVLLTLIINGQTWHWAKSGIGPGGFSEGLASATDVSGNVFITGHFQSPTVVFGSFTLTNSGSAANLYLVKYDSNGNVLWARNSSGTGTQEGNSVCTDASGNVFVTGYFNTSSVSFGNVTLTSSGGVPSYLVKYDANGNVLWGKVSGGNASSQGRSISTDASGNIYQAGFFGLGSISFGTYTFTSSNMSVYLTKYDNNGNVIWSKNSMNTGNGYGYAVCTDVSGNAYIGGYFQSSMIAFGTYSLTNSGSSDIFIAKYDPNGNVIWANRYGGSLGDNCYSLGSDPSGNIYATGSFLSSSLSFGTNTVNNTGTSDMYLTKFDSSGNPIWTRSGIGTGPDDAYSLCTYSAGVFVVGSLGNSLFSGGNPVVFGSYTLTPPSGSTDPMYIVSYDLNGNVNCAAALASASDDNFGVSCDNFGNAYVTSDFTANPFVIGSSTLTLTGTEDIFVAKFSCQPEVGIKVFNPNYSLSIFPNPCDGTFKIKIDKEVENCKLILINLLGKKVFEQNISQGLNNIVTQNLASGLYNYILLQDKEQISKGKLTIDEN